MSISWILAIVALIIAACGLTLLVRDPPRIDTSYLQPLSIELVPSSDPAKATFVAGWTGSHYVGFEYLRGSQRNPKDRSSENRSGLIRWRVSSGDSTVALDSTTIEFTSRRGQLTRYGTFDAVWHRSYAIELSPLAPADFSDIDTLRLEVGVAPAAPSVGAALVKDLGKVEQKIEAWLTLGVAAIFLILAVYVNRKGSRPA